MQNAKSNNNTLREIRTLGKHSHGARIRSHPIRASFRPGRKSAPHRMMGQDDVPAKFSTKKHKTIAEAPGTTWVNACQNSRLWKLAPESRPARVTNLAMSRHQRGEKSVEAISRHLFESHLNNRFHGRGADDGLVSFASSCHGSLTSDPSTPLFFS